MVSFYTVSNTQDPLLWPVGTGLCFNKILALLRPRFRHLLRIVAGPTLHLTGVQIRHLWPSLKDFHQDASVLTSWVFWVAICVVDFMFSCILICLGAFSFRAQLYCEIIWEWFENIFATTGFGVLRLFSTVFLNRRAATRYRAARDSPGIFHFSFLNNFHE